MGKFNDLTGQRFGKWLVLERTAEKLNNHICWKCKCDCGTEAVRLGYTLTQGTSKSCGCHQQKIASERVSHGHASRSGRTVTYTTWKNMRQRCTNSNIPEYKHYGGKGITVCERWNKYENFLSDMGERPEGRMTIDRIDTNKGYEPGNCRWATYKTQARNTTRNKFIEYKGEIKPLSEWCEVLGISYSMVNQRLLYSGHTVEEAFETPKQR